MKVKGALITTAAVAVGLLGIGAGIATLSPGVAGQTMGYMARHADFSGSRHGWHGGVHGHRLAMLCSERRDHGIDGVVGFVEGFMEFNTAQQAAWTDLTAAVRDGSRTVDKACEEIRPAGETENAPRKLARVETLMATGLDVVKRVRPAFEAFYATLSEKQQHAIDGLLTRRHRR